VRFSTLKEALGKKEKLLRPGTRMWGEPSGGGESPRKKEEAHCHDSAKNILDDGARWKKKSLSMVSLRCIKTRGGGGVYSGGKGVLLAQGGKKGFVRGEQKQESLAVGH